jgi:hypothetical protein
VFEFDAAAHPVKCDDDRSMRIQGLFRFDAATVSIEFGLSGREERVRGSDEA